VKLQKSDLTPVLAIAIGGLVSVLALGPQNWGDTPQPQPEARIGQTVIAVLSTTLGALPSREAIASGQVMIRGRVVGDAQPLIFVDGELVEALEGIHPDDIERVEVIKGEAALAAFGAGAVGGAIQIFTKNGARDDPRR